MYGSFDTMSERKLIRILKHKGVLDINFLNFTKGNRIQIFWCVALVGSLLFGRHYVKQGV